MVASAICRTSIAYEVATLSKHNSKPTKQHWLAMKQLLRFLKHTAYDHLILGGKTTNFNIHGFADSSFCKDPEDCTAPQGFTIFLNNSLIIHKARWSSKVWPSSTEAEVVALYHATQATIWLRKLLTSFGYSTQDSTPIYEDNQGCIKYNHSKDRAGKLGHINIKYHWIREKITSKEIELHYIHSSKNTADVMTKSLGGSPLATHRKSLGIGQPVHVS